MDRIVTSESVLLGEIAGGLGDCLIEIDDVKLAPPTLQLIHSGAMARCSHATGPNGRRESRPRFRVSQPARRYDVRREPQRGCLLSAYFLEQELQQGRRLEVRDHLR
jgi:hypothetical protein